MTQYTAGDIAEIIEKFAPTSYAMERDNVGLLTGDRGKLIKKILVCCDVDEHVALEAKEAGVDMIISHHPMMFNPINRLTEQNPQQKALRILIKNDICHYAAHTNLDVVRGGLCDYMAELLGLENTSVAEVVTQECGIEHGYGRIATIKEEITLEKLLIKCKEAFNCDGLRYVGSLTDRIKTVAVNTGGGAFLLDMCIEKGIDVLITGDLKYNQFRDAYENKTDIIDILHYDSEKIVIDFFEEFFAKNIPDLSVVKSKANTGVVKHFG